MNCPDSLARQMIEGLYRRRPRVLFPLEPWEYHAMQQLVRRMLRKYNKHPSTHLVRAVDHLVSWYFADLFMGTLDSIKDGRSEMSPEEVNAFLLRWLPTEKANHNCTEANAQTYTTCIADLRQSRGQSPEEMLTVNARVAALYIASFGYRGTN
jgi:hypothetical protein